MQQNRPSVLYIHGFDSSPMAEKTSIIADLGYTVIAPKIHYKESKNTYQRLLHLAQEFNIEFIVGSSLGGYTAFWLSQELNVPTLLFNPSLAFQKIDPGLVHQNLSIINTRQSIFLGMKDETVHPTTTIDWLKMNQIFEKVEIIEDPNNGHQISLSVFKQQMKMLLEELVPQEA
ncbi:MAG TPA: YqiA/YcfP family alpha/beta fold hydrolase [Chitinophagales bacterium]|nr:YqiA/YcfP family alpha/beta fold hydrolase [Chitinophagales bacterium]